jgi:diaminopimelate decarboxylase
MDHFQRRDGQLFAEEVPLSLIAQEVGTPVYIYSRATLTRHFRKFDEAWEPWPHLVCYSVKACSNLSVLKLFANLGSGFDIVSAGELHRVLKVGGLPEKVVFSGVGKREDEIRYALETGIRSLNVESEAELLQIDSIAQQMGKKAPVSLRVNPDVDAETHPYISTGLKKNKFGIPANRAVAVYHQANRLRGIQVVGLDCHIGSQLAKVDPVVEALKRLLSLVDRLAEDGIVIRHMDMGGGLGITYDDETPPSPAEYAAAVLRELQPWSKDRAGSQIELVLEPGRVIAGNAGILLMKVLLRKDSDEKRFVVVDAGMNDAIRPALYGAYHQIETVNAPRTETEVVDVVGPVCESGDFFARDRQLAKVEAGELLAMRSMGAYGFVMTSNYNSRPRPPEVMVDGSRYHVIRKRESVDDLLRGETIVT